MEIRIGDTWMETNNSMEYIVDKLSDDKFFIEMINKDIGTRIKFTPEYIKEHLSLIKSGDDSQVIYKDPTTGPAVQILAGAHLLPRKGWNNYIPPAVGISTIKDPDIDSNGKSYKQIKEEYEKGIKPWIGADRMPYDSDYDNIDFKQRR